MPLYSINALLSARVPLDIHLVLAIIADCFIMRWIAHTVANHIPAAMIHGWREEVAMERDEAFSEPRPSLLRAIRETPFAPPLIRSIRKEVPVDLVQAAADLAIMLGPPAILWFAGSISIKSTDRY